MALGRGRALLRFGAALTISVLFSAGTANADSPPPHDQPPPPLPLSAVRLPSSFMMVEPAVYGPGPTLALLRSEPRRHRGLNALYAGFVVLQVLDAHSTLTAVTGGHTEANPFVEPFADRPGMFIAAKAAATVGTIALSEKLWRKNRTAAVVLMVAANAAYAAVVAHNYRHARR